MKKNGFTLVELLATFVILGVILSIALISYTNYINSSKRKTYEDAEITMKAAAESYLTYCSTSSLAGIDCPTIPNVGSSLEIDLSTLTDQGYMKQVKDQKIAGYCTGKVTITNQGVADNYDLKYKVCLKCSDFESQGCE